MLGVRLLFARRLTIQQSLTIHLGEGARDHRQTSDNSHRGSKRGSRGDVPRYHLSSSVLSKTSRSAEPRQPAASRPRLRKR
jgi:hypothetical protein